MPCLVNVLNVYSMSPRCLQCLLHHLHQGRPFATLDVPSMAIVNLLYQGYKVGSIPPWKLNAFCPVVRACLRALSLSSPHVGGWLRQDGDGQVGAVNNGAAAVEAKFPRMSWIEACWVVGE